jgi:hypothetical protein
MRSFARMSSPTSISPSAPTATPASASPRLVGVRVPADGDDDALGLDAALPVRPLDDERAVVQALGGRAQPQVDAERPQAPEHGRGQRLLDGGQDAVEGLDHRHARAELGHRRPELEPDVAGADDSDAGGDSGQRQCAGGVQDALAVERQSGQRHGPRPGGDDRVLELEEDDAVPRGCAPPRGRRD